MAEYLWQIVKRKPNENGSNQEFIQTVPLVWQPTHICKLSLTLILGPTNVIESLLIKIIIIIDIQSFSFMYMYIYSVYSVSTPIICHDYHLDLALCKVVSQAAIIWVTTQFFSLLMSAETKTAFFYKVQANGTFVHVALPFSLIKSLVLRDPRFINVKQTPVCHLMILTYTVHQTSK